jgi:hypothetical protein
MSKGRYPSLMEMLGQPIDEICFQAAVWTYAQGRDNYREAWDIGQKHR